MASDFVEFRGNTGSRDDYKCDDLFPEASRLTDHLQLTDYVKGRIDELATAGTLYLTDLFHQPDTRVMDTAACILCGIGWQGDRTIGMSMVVDLSVTPDSVRDYRVKLRSLDNKPIAYKRGLEGRGRREWRYTGERSAAEGHVDIAEEVWMRSTKTEVDVPAHVAWQILRTQGKHCVKATDDEDRGRRWKVEEVRPTPKPEAASDFREQSPRRSK